MAVHVAGRASNYEYVAQSGETSTSHLLTNCNTSDSAGDEVSSCNKIGTGSSQHLPFRFSVSTAVFVSLQLYWRLRDWRHHPNPAASTQGPGNLL
jgi:hypothetical protein